MDMTPVDKKIARKMLLVLSLLLSLTTIVLLFMLLWRCRGQ